MHCSRHQNGPRRNARNSLCPRVSEPGRGGELAINTAPPRPAPRSVPGTPAPHNLAGEGGEQRGRGVAEDKRTWVGERRTIPGRGNSTHTGGGSGRVPERVGVGLRGPSFRACSCACNSRPPLPGGSSLLAPGVPAAPRSGPPPGSLP